MNGYKMKRSRFHIRSTPRRNPKTFSDSSSFIEYLEQRKSLDLISHILSILMQSETAKRASFRITSNSFSPSSSLIPFLLVFVFKFSFLLFDHLDLLSGIHLSRAAQDQFSLRNTLRDHIINLESRRQT